MEAWFSRFILLSVRQKNQEEIPDFQQLLFAFIFLTTAAFLLFCFLLRHMFIFSGYNSNLFKKSVKRQVPIHFYLYTGTQPKMNLWIHRPLH